MMQMSERVQVSGGASAFVSLGGLVKVVAHRKFIARFFVLPRSSMPRRC